MTLRIERYRNTRHWAVYEGETLVVVTLYKLGAREVQRRLAAQPPAQPAGPRHPRRHRARLAAAAHRQERRAGASSLASPGRGCPRERLGRTIGSPVLGPTTRDRSTRHAPRGGTR